MQILSRPLAYRFGVAVAGLLCVFPTTASAVDLPLVRAMPLTRTPPPTKVAVVFALTVHLPKGQGLARALLDLGVSSDDAATAAKLAAGHLGDGQGGCDAKVEMSQVAGSTGYRVERIALATLVDRSTIERRGGELTLTSTQLAQKTARLA